jgi:putative ABC transport system substrate-binding protein
VSGNLGTNIVCSMPLGLPLAAPTKKASVLLLPTPAQWSAQLIVQSTAHHRIPVIYSYRQVTKEGGLMSYGPETSDIFLRSASYVDRILKGANPAELPAQAPAKFEFAINLKTATTLGLTVAPTVIALADEVIE